MPNNENTQISPQEYKQVTEELYKRNLELAKLYKQVESLNHELGEANKDLKKLIKERESLIHLVTHKVKGSFTRIKFIFAGMLDGTFGDISPEIRKRAEQGLEFDNDGIRTVDLVLNVANLENGLIKYDMQIIDFKDVVLEAIDEKQTGAEAKGLVLLSELSDETYNINGDAFWLKEAVSNLIENSIRYTKAGKILIALQKMEHTVLFSIQDTGIGITDEDKKNLFTEGGRGKNSIKVNVDSTGYGLYTVKLVIKAHRGHVWAESGGAGTGSTFFIELPSA